MKYLKSYTPPIINESYDSNSTDINTEYQNLIKRIDNDVNSFIKKYKSALSDCLLYLTDAYNYKIDDSSSTGRSLIGEHWYIVYDIYITSKDLIEKDVVIDLFKRTFEKLNDDLGLIYITHKDQDTSFSDQTITFSSGSQTFFTFDEFIDYINSNKIKNKTVLSIKISPWW